MAIRINLDKNARQLALNRCCDCSYEWQDRPYGRAKYHACPKCNSVYWKWVNFNDEH